MKELFNNGISEVIYGNDLDVYTTNLNKFDRMMKRSMEAQRDKYKHMPLPVTSLPEPTSDLKEKIQALRANAKRRKQKIEKARSIQIASAKKSRDVRIKSGMSKDKAEREFNLAVEAANNKAHSALVANRKMFKTKVQHTLRSGLQENLDYLKQVKAQIQLRVQDVERKIANTKDLVASGKMSEASAQGIIAGYNTQVNQLINQMNELTKRGQMTTIDIHLKLGIISPATAAKLRSQKTQQFEDQAKRLTSMSALPPMFTYDPIDAETGRRISKSDLHRHVAYLKKKGNKDEAKRIRTIIKNMRMPGASKVVEVQIQMIPRARALNQATGEKVFSVTESERIPRNQHSLEIPSRAIAGEDQPNAKTFAPAKKPVTQSIRALTRTVADLQAKWNDLYGQAVKSGKGSDIRLNMTVGSIRDLTNEISEAKKTGKNEDEIKNKLEMLRDEYLKALKDLKTLVRRS